ncbi:MAG: aminotransferase class I/II-fold pyridoxal phosphate-dependent enzyme [Myxococcaceae bacterium]|nr:aminotransferase class I/II-fold pyridoxal phosphate-dependent enzyme [Myxococcaceae bacterium]
MPRRAERVAHFGTTVFSEFSALAQKHQAVNLGQGFPDFDGPEAIKQAAIRAIEDGVNQYAIGAGAVALRRAIAEHSKRFYGMSVDPETMVTVTSGATEAIFDTIQALVNPGDEVVLFEPFYDSYEAAVIMAGGVPRFVLLRPPEAAHRAWWFDEDELRGAFSAKTKLVVVNTPHNPTGKVFTREELELVRELCVRHDALVLSDEVYEHLVFAPARHLRPATLPGMWERTVTVSSAGKSFSFTGWKVGWAIAPEPLRAAVQSAHQFVTFATAAPFQAAIAEALRLPDRYFADLEKDYRHKRGLLIGALEEAGLRAFVPEGTYFVMADLDGTGFDDDFAFCRFLTAEIGVAAIPPSAFYGPEHRAHGRRLVRFAFCKREETVRAAAERLRRLPEVLARRGA